MVGNCQAATAVGIGNKQIRGRSQDNHGIGTPRNGKGEATPAEGDGFRYAKAASKKYSLFRGM